MTFNISIVSGLPDIREYNTEAFKHLIYSHLPYLREFYRTQVLTATAHQGLIWRGDLFGLLNVLGISPRMFWVVAILNGFDDPSDYDGTVLNFVIPTESDIISLAARNNSLDSEPR